MKNWSKNKIIVGTLYSLYSLFSFSSFSYSQEISLTRQSGDCSYQPFGQPFGQSLEQSFRQSFDSDENERLKIPLDLDTDEVLRQQAGLPSCDQVLSLALQKNHRTSLKKVKNALQFPMLIFAADGIYNQRLAHNRYKFLIQNSLQLFTEAEDFQEKTRLGKELLAEDFKYLKAFYEIYVQKFPETHVSLREMAQLIHQGNKLGLFCIKDNLIQEKPLGLDLLALKFKDQFKHPLNHFLSRSYHLVKAPHQKGSDKSQFVKNLFFHNILPHFDQKLSHLNQDLALLKINIKIRQELLKKTIEKNALLKAAQEKRQSLNPF